MKYLKQRIAALNAADKEKVLTEFESIAGELDGCLCRRIPLTLARRLSAILPLCRAFVPEATRFGVFKVLLTTAQCLTEKPEGLALLLDTVSVSMSAPAVNEDNTEDCLCGLLDAESATVFVESVMRVRAVRPTATTYGVFLAMLSWSLGFVERPANLKWLVYSRRKSTGSIKGCAVRDKKTAHPSVRGV